MAQLFLSSYDGSISTLHFSEGASPKDALKVVASTKACSPNPSWITLDPERRILYCTSNDRETLTGTLRSFSIRDGGALEERSSVPTPFGAAYHTLFNGCNALAAAYYYAGRVGIYNVHDVQQIKTVQELDFPDFVAGPGRHQDKPRPHQATLDPSGRHILVPDLGADQIRVFNIGTDPRNLHQVQEVRGLDLPRGSFPRHVAFVTLRDRTQLYILNQDISTLSTYTVERSPDGRMSMHKSGHDMDFLKRIVREVPNAPEGIRLTGSHLAVSPDNRYVLVSVRDDNAFSILSPLEPDVTISADSLLTYRVDQESGTLSLAHEVHSGGGTPRQFSLNKTGDRIAVVSQRDGWISVFARDVGSGKIGELIGFKEGFGEMGPNCIQWDDGD